MHELRADLHGGATSKATGNRASYSTNGCAGAWGYRRAGQCAQLAASNHARERWRHVGCALGCQVRDTLGVCECLLAKLTNKLENWPDAFSETFGLGQSFCFVFERALHFGQLFGLDGRLHRQLLGNNASLLWANVARDDGGRHSGRTDCTLTALIGQLAYVAEKAFFFWFGAKEFRA